MFNRNASLGSMSLVPVTAQKTVVFISTLPPDRGNLAEYGEYLLHGLAENPEIKHVHALANWVPGAAETETFGDKITIHRVWRLGSAWSLYRLPAFARSLSPDVVHINAGLRTWGVGRVANFVGAAVGARCRSFARVITTLHTIGDTVRLDQLEHGIGPITKLGIQAATRLYLRSHTVTVTLRSMQAALSNHYGADNVRHVPLGTFGVRVDEVPIAPMRVLSFGFWGAYKDASTLVGAVKSLHDQGLPIELILGGGAHPYHPEIYANLKARYADLPFVKFTGYIPENELDGLFKSVACVVQPYRTNAGASAVLNLARSYGRPLVISADPGLLEQVHDEGGSALVFRTEAQLQDALRRVLTNDALQREMGEKNLAVARMMNISTQARKMTQLYDEAPAADAALVIGKEQQVADDMGLLVGQPRVVTSKFSAIAPRLEKEDTMAMSWPVHQPSSRI